MMDLFTIKGWLFLILLEQIAVIYFLCRIYVNSQITKAQTERLMQDNVELGHMIKGGAALKKLQPLDVP